MTAKAEQNPDGYVHTGDVNEYQRLRDQALMWQGATEQVLDRIGLKPGMSCLDVGSGPGAVMRLMADRVGPEGRVTGIEIDGALGSQALADLRGQGGASFELIEADVHRARPGAGRALRPHLLPAVSHAYAGARGGAREDAALDQAGRHRWRRRSSTSAPSRSSRSARPWPNSTACSRACSEPTAAICGQGANCRRSSRRPASASLTALLAEAKFLPLKDMAQMLIGVYQSLFPAAAALGIADQAQSGSIQGRHGRGRLGRALLLSHPHPHRRLEAGRVTRRSERAVIGASPCGS